MRAVWSGWLRWFLHPHVQQRCWQSAVSIQGVLAEAPHTWPLHVAWAFHRMAVGSQGPVFQNSWVAVSLLMACLRRDWMSKSLRPAQIPLKGIRPLDGDWQGITAEESVECRYHSAIFGEYCTTCYCRLTWNHCFYLFISCPSQWAGSSGRAGPCLKAQRRVPS